MSFLYEVINLGIYCLRISLGNQVGILHSVIIQHITIIINLIFIII